MSLRGNPTVGPNVVSSNVRRIEYNPPLPIVIGGQFVLGPLQVAAQGRVGFDLQIFKPHPQLRVTVAGRMLSVTAIDEFVIPADWAVAGVTVVHQDYMIGADEVEVAVADYLTAGAFSLVCAIYSTTA